MPNGAREVDQIHHPTHRQGVHPILQSSQAGLADPDRQGPAAELAGPSLQVDVAVSRRQKTGALVAGELALSGAHARTVVRPINLSKLQGRAGPVVEDASARV